MTTHIQLHHDPSHDVLISSKPKYNSNIPYFKRIGIPMNNTESDILDLLGEKYFNNASVTWLLWKLVKLCNTQTNISVLRNSELSTTEKQRISAAYPTLFKDNIIIRTKREHYLINPKVFLPTNSTYELVLEHWTSLGGK